MVVNADETPRDALLLDPSTRVTCPKCEHEFSLEEGFAKKSLEAIDRCESRCARELKRVRGARPLRCKPRASGAGRTVGGTAA